MTTAVSASKRRTRVRRASLAVTIIAGAAFGAILMWSSAGAGLRGIDARQAVSHHADAIFKDSDTPDSGNPAGDVTIVQFFDYNCRHCRRMAPALHNVVTQDGHVRVLYKELPFLSVGSLAAAKGALAARKQGRYLDIHQALMAIDGDADEQTVLRIVEAKGLNPERLRNDMEDPAITRALDRNFRLARALKIDATPATLIADKVVFGASSPDQIRRLIEEARHAPK